MPWWQLASSWQICLEKNYWSTDRAMCGPLPTKKIIMYVLVPSTKGFEDISLMKHRAIVDWDYHCIIRIKPCSDSLIANRVENHTRLQSLNRGGPSSLSGSVIRLWVKAKNQVLCQHVFAAPAVCLAVFCFVGNPWAKGSTHCRQE